MLEQVASSEFVEDALEFVERTLRTDAGPSVTSLDPKHPRTQLTEPELADAAEELAAALERLRSGTLTDHAPQEPFLPGDAVLSLVQSELEDYFRTETSDLVVRTGTGDRAVRSGGSGWADERLRLAPPATGTTRAWQPFEEHHTKLKSDPRWLGCLVAMAIRARPGGRYGFNGRPTGPFPLADDAFLAIVGDWGTGLPRARTMVEQHMRGRLDAARAAKPGRQCHAVHLGDVYYSGKEREYRTRFLEHWAVPHWQQDQVASWSLNGNHDMYCGGEPYFTTLLGDPRFANQGRSSWFWMENARWLVVGLDTAHADDDLRGDQAGWVTDLARRNPTKKLVLLSHHHAFSDRTERAPAFVDKLRPLLDEGRVTAWLWGHEHRAVAYHPRLGVRHPVCLGNGSVPSFVETTPRAAEMVQWEEDRPIDPDDPERWNTFGFATLSFAGDAAELTFVDERDDVRFTKTIS